MATKKTTATNETVLDSTTESTVLEKPQKNEKRPSKNIEDSLERIAMALETGLEMLECLIPPEARL